MQPSTGGTFIVHLLTERPSDVEGGPATIAGHVLWDRKAEGGFPGRLFSSCWHFPLEGWSRVVDTSSPAGLHTLPDELPNASKRVRRGRFISPGHRSLCYLSVRSIYSHVVDIRERLTMWAETKELKRRVRDVIDPKRDLGHVDGKKSTRPFPFLDPQLRTAGTLTSAPSTAQPTSTTLPAPAAQPTDSPPAMPRAVPHCQGPDGTRKFTPMDVDVDSRPSSRRGPEGRVGEVLHARGEIQVGGESEAAGSRKPGEECEECA